MDEKAKQSYLEQYKKEKEKGVPFFPDILFKDAVATLVIFLILVGLVYWVGAPLEARANPADTNYTPRPEWYFLFLFQLLKYFPGNLEVVGVVGIPAVAVLSLLALPLLDRSARRHFSARPMVIGITALSMLGIIFLTVQANNETPPPAADAAGGDKTAALYTQNCAGCHGPNIQITPGTNLHEIIAKGNHQDMPAWNADLTNEQIDALAGFILSPEGLTVFTNNCAACHTPEDLIANNPIELKKAIELGQAYPAHEQANAESWPAPMSDVEQTRLLNFLVAPDGQRLFSVNCSSCHGQAVAYAGEKEHLVEIIQKGGLHLEMPGWRGKMSEADMRKLAKYTVDPAAQPDAEAAFQASCANCHGERVPQAQDEEQAYQIIATGGTHQTMPIWGEVLTAEQLEALVEYTLEAAKGSSMEVGQELYGRNCAGCHGQFGEGGPNPARPSSVIAPISTSEFLKTRDDFTLRAIMSQGQPNLGMSPFGSANGGPLSDEDIDAILAYMRSWEDNPPVDVPPEVIQETLALKGAEIFQSICAQCHGEKGEGLVGPSLSNTDFQSKNSDEQIFNSINLGHNNSAMIAWGDILSEGQIEELVAFIRQLELTESEKPLSFKEDVMVIIKNQCIFCHNNDTNGWDASSYQTFISSGKAGPAVIAGDIENSLLVQKILGTHTEGEIMPPGGKMSDVYIQKILDWIAAGALDN